MWTLLLLSSLAFAEEPAGFSLDPLFVSRFQATSEEAAADAERVRQLLEAELGRAFLLVARDEIPPFEDYDAEVYLQSCPAQSWTGCAYVIGARGYADWVITGTVAAGDPHPEVTVTYVDVAQSRVVFSFSAVLDPDGEGAFATAVGNVMREILAGAAELEDVRGEVIDPKRRAELDRQEREELAEQLEAVRADLGAMARAVPEGRLEDPKLTLGDLAEFADRDDAAPWQRVGMDERQYVRYRNSGRTLDAWRAQHRGRTGRIVGSLGGGAAWGPWGEEVDIRTARDDLTLSVVQVDQWQELQNGSGLLADLELTLGVHRWFEVGVAATQRSAQLGYVFYSEVAGEPQTVPEPVTAVVTSRQLGVRASFVPMATWPVRPTISVGLGRWKGHSLDRLFDAAALPEGAQPLGAPSLLLLELAPGAELDLGETLSVYGRAMLEAPLSGRTVATWQDGGGGLSAVSKPDGDHGLGAQLVFGVRLRMAPLWKAPHESPVLHGDEPE